MSDAPSHTTRTLCLAYRTKMRRALDLGLRPDLEALRWLLDECDMLEREGRSTAAESKHWYDRARDLQQQRARTR